MMMMMLAGASAVVAPRAGEAAVENAKWMGKEEKEDPAKCHRLKLFHAEEQKYRNIKI